MNESLLGFLISVFGILIFIQYGYYADRSERFSSKKEFWLAVIPMAPIVVCFYEWYKKLK